MADDIHLSPLTLKHYHYNSLSVEGIAKISRANIELDGPYPSCEALDMTVEIALSETKTKDDSERFVVTLTITGQPESGKVFPYRFSASVTGFFEIDHDGTIDERKQLVLVNGASMLYGAIRDQLLTLTARHRYGPMMLPSVSFRELQAATPEAPLPESDPAPKRPRKARKEKA